MSTAAIMLVKDEADVIGPILEHTLSQVDHVLAWDNLSTDGTREILDGYGVQVYDDPEPAYYQQAKMSEMARDASEESGADWIVPVDADEMWFAREGRLGDVLESMPDAVLIAEATLFDRVVTGVDQGESPIRRLAWRRTQANALRKVACRYRPGLQILPGNHMAAYPDTPIAPAALDQLVVHHFPYRSPEQFISKARNGAAAYAATDDSVPEDAGGHKRAWGRMLEEDGEDALRELFFHDFYVEEPREREDLARDPLVR